MNKNLNFLTKFSLILFGIFSTSLIVAIILKALGELGLWIGLILTIIIFILSFYFSKKGQAFRFFAWGILATLIIGVSFYIITIVLLFQTLKDL